MLLKLSVKNYILIHDLEIAFAEGFTSITGETGAGKSILLGALALILGQRADSDILLDKSKKCIIEGLFRIKGYNLERFFNDNELDFEDMVTMRREINQTGKSRAFINDTPVNLSLLKDLGDRLVNIHSQHSIITLNDANFQMAVLDSFAGIQTKVSEYRAGYVNLIDLKNQLIEIEAQEVKASGEKDYFRFLYDELDLAKLSPGEFQDIAEQLGLLTHSEEIKNNLYKAGQVISMAEASILDQLSDARHLIGNISKYKPELETLAERLNSSYIDLKDIAKELNIIEEQVFVDPSRMELLLQRHELLYRLMKKHQVTSVEELLVLKEKIGNRLSEEAGLEERISMLRNEIAGLETDLLSRATSISLERQNVIGGFETEVVSILSKLGIPMARFTVDFQSSGVISKDGIDKVKFLFSANKGVELKDLSNAASGGELSRIMLAIKSMISQKNLLPTIIFDEIDNGVSGEIAGKVGIILKRMGRQMQVIAITHLPQIAAKGDRHYWVYKSEHQEATTTYIKELSDKERIGEIAKMLSNEVVTNSALINAKELLNS